MFSIHSKYSVYRELKRAPQKLSFCFKCQDTGTVRILGIILYCKKMFLSLFLFFSMLLLCSFFRLKELFQVKNGLTTSLLFFFFLKMPKIWVGRTTLNGGKKSMAFNKT